MKNKHIWEGWYVNDFISELEPQFDAIVENATNFGTKPFESEEKLKRWCMDNQPYHKKYIPEVYQHFRKKLKL